MIWQIFMISFIAVATIIGPSFVLMYLDVRALKKADSKHRANMLMFNAHYAFRHLARAILYAEGLKTIKDTPEGAAMWKYVASGALVSDVMKDMKEMYRYSKQTS